MNIRNEIKAYIVREAVELAGALDYDLIWKKRR